MAIIVWKPGNTYSLNQIVCYTGHFYKSLINDNSNVPVSYVESSDQSTPGVVVDQFDYIPQIHQSWQLIGNLN